MPTFIFMALLSACASTPPAITEGEEEIVVKAFTMVRENDPLTGDSTPGQHIEPLAGVRCEMHNDKGAWLATTPAIVRVRRSSAPLEIECAKEGYQARRGSIVCRSPREERAVSVKGGPATVALMTPLAILPPVAIGLVGAGAAAVAEEVTASSPPKEDNLCTYRGIGVILDREHDWAAPSYPSMLQHR